MVGDMIYSISFHQFMMLIHTHTHICMYVCRNTSVCGLYYTLLLFILERRCFPNDLVDVQWDPYSNLIRVVQDSTFTISF